MADESKLVKDTSRILSEMGLENQNVEEKLKNAAFEEWKMAAEQNIPISTISQVRQIRLFCLITNVFENIIPSENHSKRAGELRQIKYLPANNNFYEVSREVYDFCAFHN